MSRLLTLFGGGGNSLPQMTNLAVWLNAQDINSITQNGSAQVAQWNDKSGNANNATQGTDANKPVYTASAINGRPALKFRNASTYSLLSVADHASLDYTSFSLFAVIQRVTDLAATERPVGKFTTTGNQREFSAVIATNDMVQLALSSAGSSVDGSATTAGTLATAVPAILEGNATISASSVSLNNTATAGTSSGLFNGTSTFMLGARDGGSDPYDGYIGEVLFYNTALNAPARMDVMRYLSRNWGIALA